MLIPQTCSTDAVGHSLGRAAGGTLVNKVTLDGMMTFQIHCSKNGIHMICSTYYFTTSE